ncbi:MAG: hypothetical protein IB618_00185 [Candidatus Pacearchaeota archaeon]|nr:MAG: hypothetical protein IB618_00185 [Candidatus Pacearchaeota archaeon]
MPNRKNKGDMAIALFLSFLAVMMPVTFTSLQPEFTEEGIKQNSIIETFSEIVLFFDLIPSVAASDYFGCCEETKNKAKCVITLENECKVNKWHNGTACDTVCQIGCCIDNEGMCIKNSINTDCQLGTFIVKDPSCEQSPLCKEGCCTIGYQKRWTTNLTCVNVYNGVWDSAVPDWLTCIKQAYEEQHGCCKSYAGCEYITGQECQGKSGYFFSNMKCYENIPGCEICQLQPTEGKCIEGFPDLYKTDSCGNVYSDEIKKYCTGGFCNPETNQCESGDCFNIYKNYVGGEFGPKESSDKAKSGEAWCVYDTLSDLGNGTAPVGSRHWRRYCLYGQEYNEPCADYRQEVCMGFGEGGQAEYANCAPNGWRLCANVTSKNECNENPFCFWWTDFGEQHEDLGLGSGLKDAIDKVGNDKWRIFAEEKIESGKSKREKGDPQICLPKIPPGYSELNQELGCVGAGSSMCVYEEAWWGLDTENKECRDDEWRITSAHTCRSVGDCGTWFNWVGEPMSGFRIIEVEEGDVEREKKEIMIPQAYTDFVSEHIKGVKGAGGLGLLNIFAAAFVVWAGGYLGVAVLDLVGVDVFFSGVPWAMFSVSKGSLTTAGIVVGWSIIATGVILILWSFWISPGAKQGAMQSIGAGLISGGAAALAGLTAVPAVLVGIVIAGIAALLYWLGYSKEFYYQQCNPSMPPLNGNDCHLCNEDSERPCSKYRCESLGAACSYNDTITVGGKTYQLADSECIATINDGAPPWITEIEAFDMEGRSIFKRTGLGTMPTTININMGGQPIPDGTQLVIQINLNEKAFCMWDIESTANIGEMDFPYQSSVLRDELRQQFLVKQALPQYYVRCADVYGNANIAEYIFKFSTTTGPDLTPPVILGTDRDYNPYFGYSVTELPLSIYISEDAFCRWNPGQDTDYELMSQETECETDITPTGWECETTLTGLQPDIANPFYIRCKDKSPQENVMPSGYLLTLLPTPPLLITSIDPTDGSIIKGCEVSGVELEVTTAEGADNGIATCYWSNADIGIEQGMTKFTETNTVIHRQNLSAMSQIVYIKCHDSALNIANNRTSFTVIVDTFPPKITRLYKSGGSLILKTDENAVCAYHYSAGRKIHNCNFDPKDTLRARRFDTTGTKEHRVYDDGEPWHVICYDECDNIGQCFVISSIES